MTALITYLVRDVLRGQRYLPPVLAQVLVLAVVFGGDPGPALPAYSIAAVSLYPASAWLTVMCVHAEDPVLRTVTVASAGGWRRVTAATVVVSAGFVVLLVLVGSVIPALVRGYSVVDACVGASAQLVTGLAGVVLGVLCARPVLARIGWSTLAVLVVVLVTFAVGRVPPVGAVIGMLSRADHGLAASQHPGLVLGGGLGLVLVLLVAATFAVAEVGSRKD